MKRVPRGYWNNYENCYNVAKECQTRGDFAKKFSAAYSYSLKNGWLDDYTWFVDGKVKAAKEKSKWNHDTCFSAAKECKSCGEFQSKYTQAYRVAKKNNWLCEYTWFVADRKSNGYWNYDTCYQAALECKSRTEFSKKYSRAYHIANINGWQDDYTWFIDTNTLLRTTHTTLTRDVCYEIAKKYKSRRELEDGASGVYAKSLKEGWLDDYTWFERGKSPYSNQMDNVYAYFFNEHNAVYVGRTININDRNMCHHNKGSVYNFAKNNGIEIPNMTILESNLSLEDGLIYEELYVKQYENDGWTILNEAKVGLGCGSLGGINNGKWTRNKCYEAALKCKSRTELAKKYSAVYKIAHKNKWLDDYTWFYESATAKKWNRETCYEVALKCKSSSEMYTKYSAAYQYARRNDLLKEYIWFEQRKPKGYWTYDKCKQAASTCKGREDFRRKYSSACEVSRVNKWLDDFFPKTK